MISEKALFQIEIPPFINVISFSTVLGRIGPSSVPVCVYSTFFQFPTLAPTGVLKLICLGIVDCAGLRCTGCPSRILLECREIP